MRRGTLSGHRNTKEKIKCEIVASDTQGYTSCAAFDFLAAETQKNKLSVKSWPQIRSRHESRSTLWPPKHEKINKVGNLGRKAIHNASWSTFWPPEHEKKKNLFSDM